MVGSGVVVGLAVWDAVGLDVSEGEGDAAAPRDVESDRDGLVDPEQAATAIDTNKTPSRALDLAPILIE